LCPITLTAVSVAVTIAATVISIEMQKKQARIQRKNAERTAQTARKIAQNQANRVAREQAETNVQNVIEGEFQRGKAYVAENKGNRQVMALTRQVDRDIQSNRTAIEMRLDAANGNVRDAYASIGATEANAVAANAGPGALEFTSMALTIGSSVTGGASDIKTQLDKNEKSGVTGWRSW
jgi:hypothetical protein